MKTETYAKGQSATRDLRAVLIGVAGEIFADRGYEAATIKEITDRAQVNVASVNYYFRDKLGLYTEVLMQCLHKGSLALGPESEQISPEERLTRYVRSFVTSLVASGRPSWTGRLMVRELAQPTPALPQIMEEIVRPNYKILRQLVADVAGCPLDDETLNLMTHSVHGQCVHWKFSCPIFPYLWPDLEFNEAQASRIAQHIAEFSIAGIRTVASRGAPAT